MRTPLSSASLALCCGALAFGCATRHTSQTTSAGTVHTLRRSHNNVHVLLSSAGAVVVDGGLETDGPALVRDLRKLGLERDDVKLVVVTHGHADHAGGAAAIAQAFDAPVLGGAGDATLFETGRMPELCPTDAIARRRLDKDRAPTFAPLLLDHSVPPGGRLELAELGLPGAVLALPGHTEGSLVYIVGDAVFVGDLIRGSIVGKRPTTHFYMCDLDDNRADLEQLRSTAAPGAATWFVGHFGPLDATAVGDHLAAPR